ncbi:F-box protein rmf [Thalictrum thalictroides]|uniref:F-box protein rmf n=1 Tax=Thalictrum thalictroides TaxID=46969 RepID=A0A7J6W3G2_THATH|nr:F-box protein rmf [Thalictrum thalictroides]
MSKRLRRGKSMCCCSSPQSSFLTLRPAFNCYEIDIWTEIAKFMGGRCLVMLGSVNRWFHRLIFKEDSVWKFACLRDLQVPEPPQRVSFSWLKLYASAFGTTESSFYLTRVSSIIFNSLQSTSRKPQVRFCLADGSHSYLFRQPEKHIDWMRIGAFYIDSSYVLLTETLIWPLRIPKGETPLKMLETSGSCVLNNIKTGIWIADLQLVRCPVCNLESCEGTMQTLDARHIELFHTNGYQNGSWEYEEIGAHESKKHSDGASGGIFDIKYFRDPSTIEVVDLKSWGAKPNDWQPKARIGLHAVAVNTNLQKNDGLHVKYHAMKAGAGGEVVSIRISQQLL